MLKDLSRFLKPPVFPDAEKNLVVIMLHRLLLTVIAIIAVFLIITLFFDPFSRYIPIAFVFLIIQIVLFSLLRTGRTSLVNFAFMILALGGLFYSAYLFGGVASASYSALIVVVIIAAITSSRKRYPFIIAGVGILFGGLLIIAQIMDLYQPNYLHLNVVDKWVGESLIFILSALPVGSIR